MSQRPSIVHIGYPKAASTFLQDYAAAHPQLSFRMVTMDPLHDASLATLVPPAKQDASDRRVEFFTNEKLAESVLLIGDSRIWHQHKFSPGTWDIVAPHVRFDAAESARRVKSGYGVGKALIIIRDQAEWLLSAYKYFLPNLPAGRRSFADFCDTPRGRIYLEAGHFDRTIEAYFNVFGEKNVKVLRTDLLRNDPVEFAFEFCGFLGVDVRPIPNGRANVGSSNLSTLVRTRFPLVDRLPAGLRKLGGQILGGLPAKDPSLLSPKERAAIRARYADSNDRTDVLLRDKEKLATGSH